MVDSQSTRLKVLIAEDSVYDTEILLLELKRAGYTVDSTRVETRAEMESALAVKDWEIILADFSLPHFNALEALALVHEKNLDIPVIVVSGTITEETAVQTMRAGARDYVLKDNLIRLGVVMRRELEEAHERRARRQAEESAAQTQNLLRLQASLLNSVRESIVATDLNGTVIYWGKGAVDLYGYQDGEVLGHHISEIVAEAGAQGGGNMDDVIRDGEPITKVYGQSRKDGTPFWAETTAVHAFDEAGKPFAIVGVQRDITDRTLAEETLRESENRYKSIFQDNQAVMLLVDPRTGEIVDVNQAACRFYGYTREQFTYLLYSSIHAQPSEDMLLALAQAYEAESSRVISKHRLADGSLRDVEISSGPVVINGRPLLYCTVYDISILKKTEDDLVHRANELTVLHAVSVAAIESADEDSLIGRATEIIGQALFPDQFGILLLDQQDEILRPHSSYRGLPGTIQGATVPLSQGISGHVARTGQICYAPDVSQDPNYLDIGNGIRSELVVPIQLGGRVIGVIDAGICRLNAFTSADTNLLVTIGGQLATAIDRLRSEESLRRQSQQLKNIYNLSQEFTRVSLKPMEVYTAIHSAAAKLMPCEAFVITLWDREKHEINGVYLVDRGERFSGFTAADDFGLAGRVIQSGQSYVEDNILPPQGEEELNQFFGTGDYVQSLVVVPMRTANNLIGTLSVQSYQRHTYTDDDVHILELLAGNAAIALQNSRLFEETRQQALTFENMFDAIVVTDINGMIIEWNPAAERIFGYTRAEAAGHRLQAILRHPPEMINLEDEIVAVVDREGRWMGESQILRKDGSKGLFDLVVVPIRDERGNMTGTLGVNRDITDRTRAEEELSFSEARLSNIITTAMDAILMVDRDGKITIFNVAAEKMFAYPAAEILGKPIERLIPNRYRGLGRSPSFDFSSFEAASRMVGLLQEATGVRSTGEEFAIEVSLSKFEVNEQLYFTVIIRDVSQRKRVDAQLVRLAAVVEQAAESVILTDTAGNITYANPFFERISGYRFDEVAGKNPRFLKSGYQSDDFYRSMWSRISTGTSWTGAFINQRKDGTYYHERATLFPIKNSDGDIINYAAVKQDISEMIQHEREMEAFVVMSKALRSASKREEMLPIILDQCMDLLEGSGGLLVINELSPGESTTVMGRGSLFLLTGNRAAVNAAICQEIRREGRAMIFNDLGILADLSAALPDGQPHALIAAPLVSQGRVNGIVIVGRDRPFQDGDLRLMTAVTDIAANATHRAALNEETLRHIVQLGEVSSAGREMIDMLNLPDIYDRLGLSVQVLLPDISSLMVSSYSPQEQLIRCVYAVADDELLDRQQLPPVPLAPSGKGLQSEVIHTRQPLIINQDLVEKAHFNAKIGESADRRIPQSALFVPMLARDNVLGVLQVQSYRANRFTQRDAEMLSLIANTAAISIEKAGLYHGLEQKNIELSEAYDSTIEGWSRALDMRDRETEGHSERVADITVQLARQFGMDGEALVHLRRGALLHDIGKVGVSDNILHKPGALNADEWKSMRMHPSNAYNMLAPIQYLRPALDIPYCHHEKWDGSGYPRGLKGEEIPLVARIFAIADVWDALTSNRPYRAAWTKEKAMDYIIGQKGLHFDPQVVDAFVSLMAETDTGIPESKVSTSNPL